MKVGLVYNLIREEMLDGGKPIDAIAEYDTSNTINAIKKSIESGGHDVVLIEGDETFSENLKKERPDIVFNVAEGLGGECRESYVPNICETFGIPYTGSGPLTLSMALDKARTKEVLRQHAVPTAKWQVFNSKNDQIDPSLRFPLIVKLLHEGSSMGLDQSSVVENEKALKKRVDYLISTYHEPALVEEFLDGREFTIGIIGNEMNGKKPRVLPIRETVHEVEKSIVLFDMDEDMIPLVEKHRSKDEVDKYKDESRWRWHSVCPAEVTKDMEKELKTLALSVFKAMGCRDWCRMEVRYKDGEPYVLELNPIAGIAPGYWFPKTAEVAGYNYDEFINLILDAAIERLGLQKNDKKSKLSNTVKERIKKS
jgi:D-alanine-D-alanine ligase